MNMLLSVYSAEYLIDPAICCQTWSGTNSLGLYTVDKTACVRNCAGTIIKPHAIVSQLFAQSGANDDLALDFWV